MSKLPVISATECIRALAQVGFMVVRQRGSHMTLVREEPVTQLTVPNHKAIAKGTLRAIIRQAELTVEDFIELLNR